MRTYTYEHAKHATHAHVHAHAGYRQGGLHSNDEVSGHKVEERGLTLLQLRDLWNHIRNRCEPEGWMGVDGALLRAETATLYEVLRYVIKPCSQSTKCSYVEYLGNGPQLQPWGLAVRRESQLN